MLLESMNEQTFHCQQGVPHFEGQLTSLGCTAAMRISKFRELLAMLLSLRLGLAPEGTDKSLSRCPKFYVKIRKSQFKQSKEYRCCCRFTWVH